MALFDQDVTRNLSYKLRDVKKGEIIPAVSDVMFYTMFNNTKRKKYVSYILSLILEKDYDYILNNIEFMNSKLDKDNYYNKGTTVDLVVKFDDKIYCIEMNNNRDVARFERNIYYGGKLYGEDTKIGGKYLYNYVLVLNINNFNFKGNNKIIDSYKLRNEDGIVLTEKIQFVNIYLPLIRKKYYNKDKLSELEKFLMIMNEKESNEVNILIGENKIMEEYKKEASVASQDTEIIGLYNKEKDDERVRLNDIAIKTEKAYNDGIEKGIEQTKIDMIKNMIKENVNDDFIIRVTNITKEELNIIKNIK